MQGSFWTEDGALNSLSGLAAMGHIKRCNIDGHLGLAHLTVATINRPPETVRTCHGHLVDGALLYSPRTSGRNASEARSRKSLVVGSPRDGRAWAASRPPSEGRRFSCRRTAWRPANN